MGHSHTMDNPGVPQACQHHLHKSLVWAHLLPEDGGDSHHVLLSPLQERDTGSEGLR